MMRVTCPLMCGDSECEEAFPKGFETQSEGWGGLAVQCILGSCAGPEASVLRLP